MIQSGFFSSGFWVGAFFLGGGGVWGDAHLRLTQNFAYTPYPTTTQKKKVVARGGANTKNVVLEEVVLVFGRAKF